MSEPENGTEGPILTVVGEGVALGPLRRDLVPLYARWSNDLFTVARFGGSPPRTLDQITEWYDSKAKSKEERVFTIYERSTLRPIGTTSLVDVDHKNQTAEFGIRLGESDSRGKGYGTETTRLVLDYGFNVVGLHNIMLAVLEFNTAALGAYRKAGFQEIGRRRERFVEAGRVWDEVLMDCLASEFEGSRVRREIQLGD